MPTMLDIRSLDLSGRWTSRSSLVPFGKEVVTRDRAGVVAV
jgi:hypothetical protein